MKIVDRVKTNPVNVVLRIQESIHTYTLYNNDINDDTNNDDNDTDDDYEVIITIT
jgi:hypothetical protein